jgi:hypothetical protein
MKTTRRWAAPGRSWCGIADPQALARPSSAAGTTRSAGGRAQAAGIARVERYYTQDMMFGRYRGSTKRWPSPTPLQGGPPGEGGEALMAGIGFELRKLLKRDSLLGADAGLRLRRHHQLRPVGAVDPRHAGHRRDEPVGGGAGIPDHQFQVSVTYLIAVSLILTGFVQLAFTRFVADRLFEKRATIILPNFNGLLLWVTLVSGLLAAGAAGLFPAQSMPTGC